MLTAERLSKSFIRRSFLGRKVVHAVRGVSLSIAPGETVGLVGESGSGKSTLGRCLAGLDPYDGGSIWYEGRKLRTLGARELRSLRKQVQLVFQDPIDALNPRLRVEQLIMEPLNHFAIGSKAERKEKVEHFASKVGLLREHLSRYPGELSRGQCQRVNIARALILDPKIIICDEIISALDVATGTQILRLLAELQQEHGYGYLFISHDLVRVIQISHRIAVMYRGELVELADGPDFHLHARHPYSRKLLAAVPQIAHLV